MAASAWPRSLGGEGGGVGGGGGGGGALCWRASWRPSTPTCRSSSRLNIVTPSPSAMTSPCVGPGVALALTAPLDNPPTACWAAFQALPAALRELAPPTEAHCYRSGFQRASAWALVSVRASPPPPLPGPAPGALLCVQWGMGTPGGVGVPA